MTPLICLKVCKTMFSTPGVFADAGVWTFLYMLPILHTNGKQKYMEPTS